MHVADPSSLSPTISYPPSDLLRESPIGFVPF